MRQGRENFNAQTHLPHLQLIDRRGCDVVRACVHRTGGKLWRVAAPKSQTKKSDDAANSKPGGTDREVGARSPTTNGACRSHHANACSSFHACSSDVWWMPKRCPREYGMVERLARMTTIASMAVVIATGPSLRSLSYFSAVRSQRGLLAKRDPALSEKSDVKSLTRKASLPRGLCCAALSAGRRACGLARAALELISVAAQGISEVPSYGRWCTTCYANDPAAELCGSAYVRCGVAASCPKLGARRGSAVA